MSASRLCVKNIPKHVDEAAVKKHFATLGGTITDVKVLKNDKGISRRIAFVGFINSAEAEKAKQYFDKTFFDTSKMMVEFAMPIGDAQLEEKKARHSKVKGKPASNAAAPDTGNPAGKSANPSANAKNERHREFMQLMQPNKATAKADEFWSKAQSGDVNGEAGEEDGERSSSNEGQTAIAVSGSSSELTNRLFIRNLSYSCTRENLEALFQQHCKSAVSITLPLDESQRPKGFAIVTLADSSTASRLQKTLDGTAFQGRLLHVLAGKPEPKSSTADQPDKKRSYKDAKEDQRRKVCFPPPPLFLFSCFL